MYIELYREQIKKLYPNIEEEELKRFCENYIIEAEKQHSRFRENELDGTYRYTQNETKYF
jgi:hypothetical protein